MLLPVYMFANVLGCTEAERSIY